MFKCQPGDGPADLMHRTGRVVSAAEDVRVCASDNLAAEVTGHRYREPHEAWLLSLCALRCIGRKDVRSQITLLGAAADPQTLHRPLAAGHCTCRVCAEASQSLALPNTTLHFDHTSSPWASLNTLSTILSTDIPLATMRVCGRPCGFSRGRCLRCPGGSSWRRPRHRRWSTACSPS